MSEHERYDSRREVDAVKETKQFSCTRLVRQNASVPMLDSRRQYVCES